MAMCIKCTFSSLVKGLSRSSPNSRIPIKNKMAFRSGFFSKFSSTKATTWSHLSLISWINPCAIVATKVCNYLSDGGRVA